CPLRPPRLGQELRRPRPGALRQYGGVVARTAGREGRSPLRRRRGPRRHARPPRRLARARTPLRPGPHHLAASRRQPVRRRMVEEVVELTIAKQKNRADGDKIKLRLHGIASSCVVVPFDGYQPTDELPATGVAMLSALAEIDTGTGVSTSVWEEASGVPRRS